MNINEFRNEVIRLLSERVSGIFEVKEYDKRCINDVVEKGICLHRKEDNVSPVIYLEAFYEAYLEECILIEEVPDKILEIVEYAKEEEEIASTVSELKCWEDIQYKLRPRLINRSKNKELLNDIPYVEYLDFAIAFYLLISDNEKGVGTISVTNQMMEMYEKDVHELYKQAIDNIIFDEIKFISICPEVKDWDIDPLCTHVLTNQSCMYGAGLILSEEVRHRILNKLNSEVYLLPSSVHEWIILRADSGMEPEYLKAIVSEVNATEIQEKDYLSDNVYHMKIDGEIEKLF